MTLLISKANEGALGGAAAYLAAHEVEGLVSLLYQPHNVRFRFRTAGIKGYSEVAYETVS